VKTFEEFVERTAAYNAAIIEAGDQPWFLDADRRKAVCRKLGIAHDTEPDEVRRQLFERHRQQRLTRTAVAR
jgi:hypothetical protein